MLLAPSRQVVLGPSLVPIHAEAWPSFSMTGVNRRWRDGLRQCEWFSEDHGLAAQMELKAWQGTSLLLLYSCGGDTYRRQRGADFTVVMHPLVSRRTEPRIFCPICATIKLRMYWRGGRWACQQCQGLVERRAVLGEYEKALVRRDALYAEVHARSKPIRALAAFERKRFELMELEHCLGSHAVTRLQAPLAHMLTPIWLTSEDDEYEQHAHETAPTYLDMPLPPKLRR